MGIPTLDLAGKYKIPIVGFGTAGQREGDELERALEVALESGYRHFDTAYIYANEEVVGKILNQWISTGKVKREELFIVTKLPPSANSPDRVEAHLKESLQKLQLDYVDLYLIHFPIWMEPKDPGKRFGDDILHPTDHVALWQKLEEQVDLGRTKTIGLSNFNISQISKILKIARIKPASLQIEIHIYLQSEELVKFAQKNGIVVVGYSSLGAPGTAIYSSDSGLVPNILQEPKLSVIAAKYNKTPGQVVLKFLLQSNIVVIPKSYTPSRIKENIDLFDFTLEETDLKTLRNLEVGEKARLSSRFFGSARVREHPEYPFKSQGVYYAQLPQNYK